MTNGLYHNGSAAESRRPDHCRLCTRGDAQRIGDDRHLALTLPSEPIPCVGTCSLRSKRIAGKGEVLGPVYQYAVPCGVQWSGMWVRGRVARQAQAPGPPPPNPADSSGNGIYQLPDALCTEASRMARSTH